MRVMVFDLETTGLIEEQDAVVTEMSYIIYDTDLKRDIKAKSFLVNVPGVEVPKRVTELTGVTTEMIRKYGYNPRFLCEDFMEQVEFCGGIVMARNGEHFDVPMMERMFIKEGIVFQKPICIDDYLDLDYPEHMKGRTLTHLAADHGILNMRPHSGLSDVMSLIAIMERGGYSWNELLVSAKTPVMEVEALVSFENKDLAKDQKFNWDSGRKKWIKRMRELKCRTTEFGFRTISKKL